MSPSEHRNKQRSELRDDQTGDDDDEEDNKEQQEKDEEEDGRNRCNGDGSEKEVGRKGAFGTSRDFRSAMKRSFGRGRKRRKERDKATADGEIRRSPFSKGGGRGGGCYVCFMQPRTEECPETPTSDPNSEGFSFEMLRELIERNDFYCKESNPHI